MSSDANAVAGATGAVGAQLIKVLELRGHRVVPISRSAGVDLLRDDLDEVLRDVRTIIDVSNIVTTNRTRSMAFFHRATQRLLAAAARSDVSHHIVLSVVGSDRVDSGYFYGKREQEALVAESGLPYTIVRATHFHEFAAQTLRQMRRGPVVFIPNILCRPVAVAEVAIYLADIAEASSRRGVVEIAGPEVKQLYNMTRALQRHIGDRHVPISVPVPGRAGRLMRSGGMLPEFPGWRQGHLTFDGWLEGLRPAQVR